jgi:hypothetical protein
MLKCKGKRGKTTFVGFFYTTRSEEAQVASARLFTYEEKA